MVRRVIRFIWLTIFVFLFFTGLALGAEPIKLGVIYPLTGPDAAAGTYQIVGVEMARDKLLTSAKLKQRAPLKNWTF